MQTEKRKKDLAIKTEVHKAIEDLALIAKYSLDDRTAQEQSDKRKPAPMFTDRSLAEFIHNILFPIEKDPKLQGYFIQNERTFRLSSLLINEGMKAAFESLDSGWLKSMPGDMNNPLERYQVIQNAAYGLSRRNYTGRPRG